MSSASADFDLTVVRDVKAMLDVMHDGAQHLLAVADALFGHEDVAAAGDHAPGPTIHTWNRAHPARVTPLMA